MCATLYNRNLINYVCKVLVHSTQNVFRELHAFRLTEISSGITMSHDKRKRGKIVRARERMWNVKNLDYKNASSETVKNSRTFTKPANYTYFHERARALSKFPRHLGNGSSLWRDFHQDESRAKCYAIILVAQWDFREVSRPITEFVRASKFHILANKVTRRVFLRDFDFNDLLINSERLFS